MHESYLCAGELQAKNQKRLLAKVRELADVCMQRQIPSSGNYDVYTDAKGHAKGDFEVKLGMLHIYRLLESAVSKARYVAGSAAYRGAEYIAEYVQLVRSLFTIVVGCLELHASSAKSG